MKRELKLNPDKNNVLKAIINPLSGKIVGQDRAINELRGAIQKAFSKLNNPKKPLGVYMFAGPSRVGKTETAYALAQQLKSMRFEILMKSMSAVTEKEDIFTREEKIKMQNYFEYFKIALFSALSAKDLIHKNIPKKDNAEEEKLRNLDQLFGSISLPDISSACGGIYEMYKDYYRKAFMVVNDEMESFELSYPSIIRVDCENFKNQWSTTSLTSSSPGYVGSDRAGLLDPAKINGNFGLIILFDEIEKAHPNIHDILLQIFDCGKLTLANARGEIDFTKAIIIMTSNIGSRDMEKQLLQQEVGFRGPNNFSKKVTDSRSDEVYKICKKAYSEHFSREFRNRVDRMIAFRYLDRDSLLKILDLEINKFHSRILESGKKTFKIVVDKKVKDFILNESHFEEQAAGIINLFDREIVTPISSFLMQEDIKTGDEVSAYLGKNKKIEFVISGQAAEAEKPVIKKVETMKCSSGE